MYMQENAHLDEMLKPFFSALFLRQVLMLALERWFLNYVFSVGLMKFALSSVAAQELANIDFLSEI